MTSKTKYRLEKVELNQQWDEFVYSSPSSSAFVLSGYLNALPIKTHAYFCYKSNELMAAILLIVADNEKTAIGHDLVIYDGLFYRDLSHLNQAQQHSEQFAISTFVAEKLTTLYPKIRLTLSPSHIDLRSFHWVNYGTELTKYQTEIYYTSQVCIEDFNNDIALEDINLYQQASVARRQEIRYGFKKNVALTQSTNVEQLVDFYRRTMERQQITVESNNLQVMANLVRSALDTGIALMYEAITADGYAGSMAVFIIKGNMAYYLFGANDPDFRNAHTGTAVLWQSFYQLNIKGITTVDLEGVNSPHRGWFKLSFGGDISPYYRLLYAET